MLSHGRQNDPEEPTVSASGLGLEQVKIVLFTFDRAFSTGAGIAVTLPEIAVSGDQGMEAVVVLGIGIDDPTVG